MTANTIIEREFPRAVFRSKEFGDIGSAKIKDGMLMFRPIGKFKYSPVMIATPEILDILDDVKPGRMNFKDKIYFFPFDTFGNKLTTTVNNGVLAELNMLREENRRLQNQCEDLNEQLRTLSSRDRFQEKMKSDIEFHASLKPYTPPTQQTSNKK